MGIFGEKKTARTLEEDLWALRNRIDQLESSAKIGKLEAAEVYEKTLRLLQRMTKRYAADLKDNGGEMPTNPASSSLASLDPISRSIHERRGTSFLAPGETE